MEMSLKYEKPSLMLLVNLSPSRHLPNSALTSGVESLQTQQSFNLISFFNVRAHEYFINGNKVHELKFCLIKVHFLK